ncbi:MAG TPA: energy transducer TonB [Candidatus Acidoferrales bacterium]|nr:energy transducer TonB [Candidatus Acidoferrales bacterium]
MSDKSKWTAICLFVSLFLFSAGPATAKPRLSHPAAYVMQQTPYPQTTDGLHRLVADMLDAQRKGGPEAVAKYLPTLVLPGGAAWFSTTFGDLSGPQLAIFYNAWAGFRNSQLSGDLVRAIAAQMTQVEVLRFDKPDDPGTTSRDDYFLSLRQEPESLYVVVFRSASGATMRWAYFVFADDAFRYLGELPDLRLTGSAGISGIEKSSPQLTRRIRVDGNVMAARIEHQVAPVYPAIADTTHIEGTVVLHSVIGKDGSVQDLQVVSGPPLLMRAAMDAVRQWRYSPFLLNGQP